MKAKVKEVLKVAGVSALALGLFSGVFMSVNCIAFAQATNQTVSLPAVEMQAMASTLTEPLRTNERGINIERVTDWFGIELSELGANSISVEEGAEAGIDLLERYFDADLRGKTVHMIYFGVEEPEALAPNVVRLGGWLEQSFWRGTVLPTGAILDDSFALYSFELDGETGNMLSVERNLFAATALARSMNMHDIVALESNLRFENNEHVIIAERGGVHLSPDAPEDALLQPIFEPFTTEESIVYANHAMQVAEELNILDNSIARARVMLNPENLSAWRVLNANLELDAVVTAHVQCVDGNDAVLTFVMRDNTLVHLDFGRFLTFPVTISGNDAYGNPIETTTEIREQPTRFDWVYR